jgi:hypothetical protein
MKTDTNCGSIVSTDNNIFKVDFTRVLCNEITLNLTHTGLKELKSILMAKGYPGPFILSMSRNKCTNPWSCANTFSENPGREFLFTFKVIKRDRILPHYTKGRTLFATTMIRDVRVAKDSLYCLHDNAAREIYSC